MNEVVTRQCSYMGVRHDRERKKRFPPVELIIDEADWEPPPAPEEIVSVNVIGNPTRHGRRR